MPASDDITATTLRLLGRDPDSNEERGARTEALEKIITALEPMPRDHRELRVALNSQGLLNGCEESMAQSVTFMLAEILRATSDTPEGRAMAAAAIYKRLVMLEML